MPSFCGHEKKVLKSDGWVCLIKEVGQTFEFRDCFSKYSIRCSFKYNFFKNEKTRVEA